MLGLFGDGAGVVRLAVEVIQIDGAADQQGVTVTRARRERGPLTSLRVGAHSAAGGRRFGSCSATQRQNGGEAAGGSGCGGGENFTPGFLDGWRASRVNIPGRDPVRIFFHASMRVDPVGEKAQ